MTDLERQVRDILGPLTRTHWGRRIVAAAKRGKFTAKDRMNAAQWPACACGKMYSRKPYEHYSGKGFFHLSPNDHELAWLGQEFSKAVGNDWILDAAHAMAAIEARGEELQDHG